MTLALNIAGALVCVILWVAMWRYAIIMFQQNSYKPKRYLTWARGKVFRPLWQRNFKVKFVMTPRMVRLTVVGSLIFVGLALLSPWAAVAAVVCCDAVLLLANLIVSPVEAAIRKWYLNDAARMLRERPDLVIVGVTGSYGKTSTKNYLYRILSEKYNVLVTPGNFNTTLGVVRTVREQLKPYHQVFIVEMGAKQVGDIKEICDLVHPTLGIVTAVGDMHLETFGCRENIQKTKFELIEALPASGFGAVNMDSEGIATYAGIPTHCEVARYGIEAHRADWRAADIRYSASGTDFRLIGPGEPIDLHTSLLGECNVLDIAGAAVVALRLGVEPRQVRLAVAKLQQVQHRLSVSVKGGLTVLDDAYNSNPEGARMALSVMRDMPVPDGGRRIVITPGFVEMGSKQQEAVHTLGAQAALCATDLIVVNKVNRDSIRAGALEAGMPADRVVCVDTLAQAVAYMQQIARPGDIVLYENDLPDMFK